MKRAIHIPILLTSLWASLWLPGCTVVTAVSAVPGVLFEAVGAQVKSEAESFPRNIEPTTAAVQNSLRSMKLEADVLEVREDGYGIAFGNDKLSGKITLEEMTPKLTTMRIKVRSKVRQASVERAIIDSVRSTLEHTSSRKRFVLKGYKRLRERPDPQTAHVGWYRSDAQLDAHRHGKSDWYRLTLPSGKSAYLNSEWTNIASK